MKIDSQEKNLIRRLHRKHSVINEVTTGGTAYDEWACMSSQSQNPGCNGPHPGGSFNTGQLNVLSIHTSTPTSNGGYECNQSCQPGFGYQCNPSGEPGCVQSASGQYSSLSQCQQSCGSYGDEKYNCVNNSCTSVSQTDPGYSSAPFLTMDECQDSMCGERRGPINPRGPKTTIPVNNAYAKKGNVKTNLREEVSRAKLMWGYDTSKTLNEQGQGQNPCIDPSTIDPQYQPLGVACLCSLNVGWSNGNQYGGTIELDGCMPPNGSVFKIYVNNNFAAQGSSFSFSANIPWQGQQTPIIKVKTVLECTGQHPACSEETIEKSICIQRSTGNRVSCGKRLPDSPLKSDKMKSKINEEGLIGPRTKGQQDWLDDFNDYCSCPPPYSPCGCNGSIQPPGVTPVVWAQIQKAKSKRVIEQILSMTKDEKRIDIKYK